MNMLEENKLSSEPITGAKLNKKLKVKDSHKTICRIIAHSFKSANAAKSSCDHDKFIATATKIREGLATSREILKQPILRSPLTYAKSIICENKTLTHTTIEIDSSPTSLNGIF